MIINFIKLDLSPIKNEIPINTKKLIKIFYHFFLKKLRAIKNKPRKKVPILSSSPVKLAIRPG